MDKSFTSLRAIFDEASEMEEAAARAAFVARACAGDESLRRRVEALLRAHETAGGFLRGANDSDLPSAAIEANQTIGRYQLLEKLGEGGCGVVYLAEQQEPVKRQVALKVIKLGMDTRSVNARFEAERQALALMEHPNIARVFDAGATPSGRPYFVMELVRGVKITEYCDQNRLSTRERLGLFVQVCHAIQHAHQKGVIHRDIKPSNILVARHDGAPVPKIIDFGIAKATSGVELTDKTLFTQFELLIGTPAYMSPEQAEMSGPDIDTRSDIYSLGVLLYELLTGRPPFDSEKLLKSGLDAMRRTIRETEPDRPSTRLRALTPSDLGDVARRRRSEPPRLISLVRGDLDWIVLKALEKDRARRYETANGLAMDVQRHLDDQPVGARPPTGLDHFRKLVRRNKGKFAAVTAVALALVIGLGVSTVLFVKERQARREADLARVNEARQRDEADAKAAESLKRLVRLHVARGNSLVEEGDSFCALPWLVEALRQEQGDAAREDVHRRRVAAVLRGMPALESFWVHGGLVHEAQFSPDGERVVSASLDHTARVWDARTGEPLTPLLRCRESVDGARFSPDGRRVLTVERDGTLRFWDTRTGAAARPPLKLAAPTLGAAPFSADGRWLVAAVPGGAQIFDAATLEPSGAPLAHSNALSAAQFSPDGRLIAAMGRSAVYFWDVVTRSPTLQPLGHKSRVTFFTFSPDGGAVATLTAENIARVWSVATGAEIAPPMPHASRVYSLRFSPDGSRLATAEWNNAAHLWDVATGRQAGLPLRHRGGVRNARFSPDGRAVATASWDNTARLWNPRTAEPLSPLLRHGGFVLAVDFAPDGQRLLTAGQDSTVRLWRLPARPPARLTLRHGGGVVHRATFSSDGRRILTVGDDRTARVWERESGQPLLRLAHASAVLQGVFSPDGTRVLTGCGDGSAHLWDATSGRELIPPLRHAKAVRRAEFSPDGRRFLTAIEDGPARVWRTTNGAPVTPPLTHAGGVYSATFSPDGRRIVTVSRDKTAHVWDAETGARLSGPFQHPDALGHAAFSPDGRRVVTSCRDEEMFPAAAYVWDVASGKTVGPPLQHRDGVRTAVFSPDGRLIATASEDNTAAIWDAATGAPVTPPLLHRSIVWHAVFSPDGRLVLTGSSDATARVWDAATGEPVTPPLIHQGMVSACSWSPDGREIVTGSYDGTVQVWDVSPAGEPLARLQHQAELLSAHRLKPDIGPTPLSAAEMQERWSALTGRR